jgi:hypothetical protein
MTEIWLNVTSTLMGRLLAGMCLYIIAWYLFSNVTTPKKISRISHAIALFFLILNQKLSGNIFSIFSAYDVDLATALNIFFNISSIFVYVYTAAGRSLAIYGSTYKTFYSAIPILNLILIIRSSKEDANKTRFWLRQSLSLISVVIVGLALAFFGMIAKFKTDQIAAASEINLKNMNIKRAAKIYALIQTQYSLQTVSENMILLSVTSSGLDVKSEFYILKDQSKSNSQNLLPIVMPAGVKLAICANNIEKYLIQNGVRFAYSYTGLDKNFGFTISDCQ